MKPFRALTAAQQLAEHLRGEIAGGAWGGVLPGVLKLAKELGASTKTVMAAVDILEREGVVSGQGARRRCRIMPHDGRSGRALRVGILIYDPNDRAQPLVTDLRHALEIAGHAAFIGGKSLVELKRDPRRVAALVRQNPADAWVVMSGPQQVLEWFATSGLPCFAIFGRRRQVAIPGAGPDKIGAMHELVDRLFVLEHRRIVLYAREERRKPSPGAMEQAFLDALEAHGVATGSYNLPDWEETPDGFLKSLDSLFGMTPPTALILDQPFEFLVAQQHLARKGILAPDRVSLVCLDPDPVFAWMRPEVAHIRWDPQPLVRRVANWVEKLSRGRSDRRQTEIKARFVDGGTVGPPP